MTPPLLVMVKMPMQPPPELATIQSWPVSTPGLLELPGATVPTREPLPPEVRNQTWMSASLSLVKVNPTPDPPEAELIEP